MATRGFEFAYMLDRSGATPVIRDFTLGEASAHLHGDAMTMESDGNLDLLDAGDDEVLGIMQESVTPAAVDVTKAKVAIVTRNQVWRCSMGAATTALVRGYTKTADVSDQNTIDAAGSSAKMIIVDVSELDEDGNVLAYVIFGDTTFGNT